jgi:hypothetical protein
VDKVLDEAYDELLRPEPGRNLGGRSRSPEEIVRLAASSFMYSPGLAIRDRNYGGPSLFERFNLISSLMYEGAEGRGRMLLSNPGDETVDMVLEFSEPVPFRDARWSRKVLQMASSDIAVIADCEKMHGLGIVAAGVDPWASQSVFEIEFIDHYHWRLSCGGEPLLVSRYGAPALPQESFPRGQLVDTYERLFPMAEDEHVTAFMSVFEIAAGQRHGSMIVVAEDAAMESQRLSGQGTKVRPMTLTPEVFRQVSSIDGTIIVDPYCVCHAIGVILDGPARAECTPSRGARYNSGIRYVGASDARRLAVVVSDDHTVDVIPLLPPRVRRSTIERMLRMLEGATRQNYHQAINWLDRHRFYLDQAACERVNTALERIRAEPKEVGEIMIQWREFSPDPDLDDGFFEEE